MRLSSQTNTNTLGKCTCGNAVGLLTYDIDAERCPNCFVCQSHYIGLGIVRSSPCTGLSKVLDEHDHHTCTPFWHTCLRKHRSRLATPILLGARVTRYTQGGEDSVWRLFQQSMSRFKMVDTGFHCRGRSFMNLYIQENYHLSLKWLQGLLRGPNIDPEILNEYHHLSSTTREGYRSRPSAGASLRSSKLPISSRGSTSR